ncbi:Mobile element protein [Dissulfuribacter thermophilus]|uniref:Mobile element protein n=1 Tax=Dissulfuribacter thermophilus TaxID=1156395 RepID=A0A1B9F2K2_9BACT|nr:Mobile element protein [Dissulfuribacter thermophilus]
MKGDKRWQGRSTPQSSRPRLLWQPLREKETTNQIASRFGGNPGQVRQWKRQMLDNASVVFDHSQRKEKEQQVLLDQLYQKIGQLKVERDFLARKFGLL